MADSQMEAVKRAYAEIMLNTAKESAARILAAERRAAALERGLAAAKDDAVAALLRLKAIMESRIKEVELQSLGHVKKIQELEVQLHDAQNTIVSLQTKLQRTNSELDQTRKTLAEENRNSHSTFNNCEKCSSDSKMLLQDGSGSPAALETSSTMNERIVDGSCCFPRNSKEKGSLEDLEKLRKCNPDLESFIIRSNEPELYRNGCTQRIRAIEHHSLTADAPLGQSDEQVGELKSHMIIGKNGTGKNSAHSIVEEALQIKSTTNCKRRRGRRSKPIYKLTTYNEQAKVECKQSDTSDRNGCMLLIQALEQNLSPAKVSAKQADKQFTDLNHDLLTGQKEATENLSTANPAAKEVLEVKNLHVRKRKRSKTVIVSEPCISDWEGVPDSCRTPLRETDDISTPNGRPSSGSPEICRGALLRMPIPLVQCTAGISTSPSDAKPSQFDYKNKSPLGLEPNTNETRDEDKLPVDCREGRTQEDDTAGKKEENKIEICNPDSDKASAPSSLAKEENATLSCGTSSQAEGVRLIKYTFNRRRRKSQRLDSNTETVVPEKNSSSMNPAEKEELELHPQKQILLTESPRSNRRLVQVARQLISLSGKRW